jgi:hypothetical protein
MISYRQADLMQTLKDQKESGRAYFHIDDTPNGVNLVLSEKNTSKRYRDVMLEALSKEGWQTDFYEGGWDAFKHVEGNDAYQTFLNLKITLFNSFKVIMKFVERKTMDGGRLMEADLIFGLDISR